jgi:hypothetical protein
LENAPRSREQEGIQTVGRGHHGAKNAAFIGPAVMQRHNFKTRWKPFIIAPPFDGFSGEWTMNSRGCGFCRRGITGGRHNS